MHTDNIPNQHVRFDPYNLKHREAKKKKIKKYSNINLYGNQSVFKCFQLLYFCCVVWLVYY